MRIINHTHYSRESLRQLIKLVADLELEPAQAKLLTIEVAYFRTARSKMRGRGHRIATRNHREGRIAGLKYNRFPMYVAREVGRNPSVTWVATLLAHEMAECRGRSHEWMQRHAPTRYGYRGRLKKEGPSFWDRELNGFQLTNEKENQE